MRVNFKSPFGRRNKALGRRRSVLAGLWDPLSKRERFIYASLVLVGLFLIIRPLVQADVTDAGSIVSIPATECTSDASWYSPELAAGQPTVAFDGLTTGVQEIFSAQTTEITGALTCDGYANTDDVRLNDAITLTLAGITKAANSQPTEYQPSLNTAPTSIVKTDGRDKPLLPNAYAEGSSPSVDGWLTIEISNDKGKTWELLHVLDDKLFNETSPQVNILLPEAYRKNLNKLAIRVQSLRNDETDKRILLDAVTVTYEIGQTKEISLKAKDESGKAIEEELPVLSPQTTAEFELTTKDPNDGIIQGIGSKVSQVVDRSGPQLDVNATVVDEQGSVTFANSADVSWKQSGLNNEDTWDVSVDMPRSSEIGKYTITIEATDESGATQSITQDFLWGVLAMNPDKSIYTVGDQGLTAITVLDELGRTVCDSTVRLEVTGPINANFSTSDGSISVGEQCEEYGDHSTPDYYVNFDYSVAGLYDFRLTATTQNGTYSITEQIETVENPTYSVRRTGPTRIFPPVTYTMELEITANQTFVGDIVEAVPANFTTSKTGTDSYNTVTTEGETNYLHFPVQILEGETVVLRYQFNAPEISPEFYLLGPLTLNDDTGGLVFEEARQWQLAGDAIGRMIIFWDGASIPSGWTCISCSSGDDFYQRFVRGAATYGTTGGADTHTHTATGTVTPTGAAAVGEANTGAIAVNGHGHSFAPTLSSPSNIPSYRQLKMIRYNTTGEPATLPAGAIAVFDATVPTGWTQYSAQNGFYVRGEGTAGTTGGSNTHTVSISGTTGTATGGGNREKTGLTQVGVATTSHTHTVSGTSAPASNEPSYIQVILGKLNSTSAPTNNIITMWDDQPATGWNNVSGSGDPLNNKFIKPAASYGTTGGADTHTHSDTVLTSSAPSLTASTRSGSSSASSTHTHSVTSSSYSSPNHLPPYREVVFAKRAQVTTFDQTGFRFYDNDNSADVGSPLAALNTVATAPAQGTPFRLRMTVHVTVLDMPTSALDLKLQYALRSGTCDIGFSGETYADVGTASGDIRYYDNSSPANGNALTTNANDPTHSSDTIRAQTYVEANNFTNSQQAVAIGEDGLWDFSLVDYSAPGTTAYCFRIVRSSGTTLTNYTVVPQITTAVPPPKMILLYDGATIPTDWTCISCSGGDEAYQRFIRGEATFGTGGNTTHTHTASGSVAGSTDGEGRNNTGSGLANTDHGHTFAPTIGSASNLPSYRQLKLIKYNTGTPATIPSGAIALFDATVPSGWTQYSAQDGQFVRGEGTAGSTGGSNTHTNSLTGTTGVSTGGENAFDGSASQEDVAVAGHTHTVSGTTDSVDNQPPFIETILGQANTDTSIPGSMIALWDQDPGGTWTCVSCTGSDPFYQTFFKPAATYGTTGGAVSHTHGTANITSSGPSSITATRAQNQLSSPTHTHTVTVDTFSTDNHLPPYVNYILAKSASTNSAPNNPTSLTQEKTDTSNLTVGSWTNESTVIFTASATDPDNPDGLAICVEVEQLGTAFDNVNTACGSTEAYSGSAVTVSLTQAGLSDGAEYHWQARVKDGLGAYSSWVSFGANAESARDFAVDSSGPTGTVYDGTSTGVDIDYNNGALDTLSANWNIDASVSGLVGYEYSIGTVPAATDVANWTSTGTTPSATATSLSLTTSQPYYINVRTTDNAGSQSIISSDGQFVAPTLSFLSSPNEVQFDVLGAGNSYTSTKATTLTTSTNAYNGYVIRAFATGLLTNQYSTTVSMFDGGTYASPDEWLGGDTGYGYTSNDSSIQGSNLFGSIPCTGGGNPPCYAPFSLSTPGDIVADHTNTVAGTPVVNENFIVTHRVTTSASQDPGDYTTTIIFTVTAIY